MKAFWKKIEKFVDKSIPYALILLTFMILADVFYYETLQPYYIYIELLDSLIITIFVIDLAFKYKSSKSIPQFFRLYWLDIIAVFPFFLVFRIFEEATDLIRLGERAQRLLHEGLEVQEFAKEIRLTRTERFLRFLRPLQRLPRMAKAVSFYKEPKKK